MDIVREFKRPLTRKLVLDIPQKFVQADLEILIIPISQKSRQKSINKNILFDKLCGLWEGRENLTLENIRLNSLPLASGK